ncbi:MAG TPA: hypothetical protein VNV25_25460 [Gemmatimonadaceae bacterium]|jgi:hypothetical protein|nr:hypothetical protein [Gemmatimonadaceae bacterium]
MRGDIGNPNAVLCELRPADDSRRRLVLETRGVKLKIDLRMTEVFSLMDECLDALVQQDDVEDKCPSCNSDPHTHDCVLVCSLQNALRELRRRGA